MCRTSTGSHRLVHLPQSQLQSIFCLGRDELPKRSKGQRQSKGPRFPSRTGKGKTRQMGIGGGRVINKISLSPSVPFVPHVLRHPCHPCHPCHSHRQYHRCQRRARRQGGREAGRLRPRGKGSYQPPPFASCAPSNGVINGIIIIIYSDMILYDYSIIMYQSWRRMI